MQNHFAVAVYEHINKNTVLVRPWRCRECRGHVSSEVELPAASLPPRLLAFRPPSRSEPPENDAALGFVVQIIILVSRSLYIPLMATEVHYQYMRSQPSVPGRRQPFSNTGNQLPAGQDAVPAKPTKAPSSPPLPRQNTKTAPPSPPQLIYDKDHAVSYSRVGFLGEVSLKMPLFLVRSHAALRVDLRESTRLSAEVAQGMLSR